MIPVSCPLTGGELALIAGEGLLPALIADGAARAGHLPFVYYLGKQHGLQGIPEERIIDIAGLPSPGGGLDLRVLASDMKKRGITAVTMAGRVPKTLIYSGAALGASLARIVSGAPNDDHSLLGRVVEAFEAAGFSVVSYRDFIAECLAPDGTVAGRTPTETEEADVRCGMKILEATLPLSFGQSVVVAGGAVVAVEAMEGTDEMIRRAGGILSGRSVRGGSVVKMMRRDQDERFDIPTVGSGTLRNMRDAGLSCLALEFGRTIILEREQFARLAAEWDLSVVGVRF